jgi:hypothetical protein
VNRIAKTCISHSFTNTTENIRRRIQGGLDILLYWKRKLIEKSFSIMLNIWLDKLH